MERELTGTKLFIFFKHRWTITSVIHHSVQGYSPWEKIGLETSGKDGPAWLL